MKKGLLILVKVLKPGKDGDYIDSPGVLEFIEDRVYLSVFEPISKQDVEIGFFLDDLLDGMRETFFDPGAD